MHQYTIEMSEEYELNHFQNDGGGGGSSSSSGGVGVVDNSGVAPTSSSSNSKAEYFIQQLNSNNFKKLALCIVIGFIVYHGILNWQYGE